MKILPIIAAANSAFGKSVTDMSYLLNLLALYIVILSLLAKFLFAKILVGLGLKLKDTLYKIAIEFSMLPTNCCFW